MTPPVRLGLIGLGHWGRICLRTITQSLPQACLTAVASRSTRNEDLGVPVYGDWHDVLNGGLCDGVVIASPAHTHVPIAMAAIKNGLAVFIEKPLCMDVREARAFGDAFAASPVPAVVDHIHLYNPAFRRLLECASELGPVLTIDAEAGKPSDLHMPVLWDWGAHDAAMCMALMGQVPDMVQARWERPPTLNDRHDGIVVVQLGFGAVPATLRLGALPQRARRMTVTCQGGTLVYDDIVPQDKLSLNGRAEPVLVASPLQRALAEFCRRIHDYDVQATDVDLAIQVVEVLSQAEKSMK